MATTETPVSSQVYNSRDNLRTGIIEKLQEYLELENVDLTKSSFLSFIIEILSTLSSNLMFYQMSSYREFFLTKAQLPESIYNLAAFLGYSPSEATPAEVNVLFTIPFGFTDSNTQFTIDEGFEVSAEGGILFSTYYDTTITVTNNSLVTILVREGNRTYNLPVTIESSQFLFVLPFRQSTSQTQEFQISEDLQQYQFVSLDVPFTDQLYSISVRVKPPNSASYETYTEVASLFLMSSTTKGFVSRRTDDGVTLQFGNGLIGYQPQAGSTVEVTLGLTQGEDGNVISGSITSGDRIYNTTLSGITQIVEYDIVNTSPAFNGADEESLEEIRSNAIANISALDRLVNDTDFVNVNAIIDDSPIGQNSLPVLKRSDLKINEISLFSTLYFGSDLVYTRNLHHEFYTTTIPRKTILTENGIEYYTIFDIEIDTMNSSASYTYNMYEIEQIPTLVTSYGSDYDLYADNLIVTRSGTAVTFELQYKSTESDASLATCEMEISESGSTFNMINDSTAFTFTIPNASIIPTGDLTYFFTIEHPIDGQIAQYSNNFIVKLDLSDFTVSNVVSDGTSHTVYDIPTIRKSYYDNINQRDFEVQTMQQLLTTLTFKDYRMLTDFINFKFSNTTGKLVNMQLNETDLANVLSKMSDPPVPSVAGERYLVINGTGAWYGHDNDIAISTTDGTTFTWIFTEPKSDLMVYVINEDLKYIYADSGWVAPLYDIPLSIFVDVFIESTYTGTVGDISQSIKETLVNSFSDRFGINANIYRSEIIDTVQGVEGVDHCVLIEPASSIFFNFNVDDFTQEELLEYSPEYIYFTEDDITVRVF